MSQLEQAAAPLVAYLVAAVLAQLQQTQAPAPAPAPSFLPPQSAPVTPPAAMPPAPSFLAPAPAPAAPAGPVAPFTDAKGLTDYVMASYQKLGPEKGAQIQNIIQHLGHANVNDLRPDQYGAFFGFVEQLKAA